MFFFGSHSFVQKAKPLLFGALFLSFFWSAGPALASGEFDTTLVNTHTVDATGKSHIQKRFSIKNNFSTLYIKKYGIELSSNKITNVKVYDSNGPIPANVVNTDAITTVGIEFEDKVVGKDQVRNFTVEYDDPDAAIVSGNVIEVYVPRLADPEKFNSYTAIIKVPAKFGSPNIANPSTFSTLSENNQTVLTFQNDGKDQGISVIFGEKQFFDFSLTYNLKNPTNNQGVTQIALPPDTSYQKVKYSQISPRPEKIQTDLDGNWIATYFLQPNESQTVTAKGVATVYLEPQTDFPIFPPQPQHVQSDTYWETSDPIIANIATKYPSPKSIYDFTVNSLEYNYNRLDTDLVRKGAKKALEEPKDAVCQEYTDLFISICRASGIPSRQATGFAYTNNPQIRPLSLVKDVLHAWPEYFDEKTQLWVPIDPTWASTTGGVDYFTHLDFNHFVFAYEGISSEKPYPAGSYKESLDAEKSIFVTVTDKDLSDKVDIDINVHQPLQSFLNLFGTHTLIIENKSGQAIYNIPISIEVSPPLELSIQDHRIERLLPYQKVEIPFDITGTDWIRSYTTDLPFEIGDQSTMQNVLVGSQLHKLHLDPTLIMYGSGITVFLLSGLFMGRLIYLRLKKKRRK